MIVVLNEKPSQARNFAKALGGMEGSFEGERYSIVALHGHVYALAEPADMVPEGMRARIADWRDESSIPWDPAWFDWSKVPRSEDGENDRSIVSLRRALARADEVAIATDLDPSGEGEVIAWEALDALGWKGRTTRVRHADEAPESIVRAFRARDVLPDMDDDPDYRKGRVRERWDLLSMQFTRIACNAARPKGYGMVREGRLKSVMVALAGRQLDAYANYVKRPFYEARFRSETGAVFARGPESARRFPSKEEVRIEAARPSPVVETGRKRGRKAPPRLLDLAGIAAILSGKGFGSKEVLDAYQALYTDGYVSYPRTEDKTVTPAQFSELLPKVDAVCAVVGVDPALLTRREPRPTHVKPEGAHGANRPGARVPASLGELSRHGAAAPEIYRLCALSYLAMLAPDFEFETVEGRLELYPAFTGKAVVPLERGFKAVFDAEAASSDMQEGDAPDAPSLGTVASPYVHEGANKRPQRPTQKWLMRQLERHDVGTGATRTGVFAEATDPDHWPLMTAKKGVLGLTDEGRASYVLTEGTAIADPAVTARLLSDMADVGAGAKSEAEVLEAMRPMVRADMAKMRENAAKLAPGPRAAGGSRFSKVGTCPRCGADAVLKDRSIDCSTNRRARGTYELLEGCGWSAPRAVAGKPLTEAQARSILAGKKVKVAGLKKRAGGTFEARLYAKTTDPLDIGFDFSAPSPKKGSGKEPVKRRRS